MQKIKSFHFIKAICAIGIIAYHYSCHLESQLFLPLYRFRNGAWGDCIVMIFFMVSGSLLYYNYAEKIEIATYLKKRWLSIFPMFYLAYASYELGNIFKHKIVLYRGRIWPYIFTLLGMDGYLIDIVPTHYILGEWFLGMIIILYLLFPILRYAFLKSPGIVGVTAVVLYLFFIEVPIINAVPFWSITSCLVSFVMGMVFVKYRSIMCKGWIWAISITGTILLLCVNIGNNNLGAHLMAVVLYICLMNLGELVMKVRTAEKCITEVSRISYAVFLIQHLEILQILEVWNPETPFKVMVILTITIALILVEAKMLTLVTDAVVRKGIELIETIKNTLRVKA